jgi:hypothetical protein
MVLPSTSSKAIHLQSKPDMFLVPARGRPNGASRREAEVRRMITRSAGLKILCDLALWKNFRAIKPPEEKSWGGDRECPQLRPAP